MTELQQLGATVQRAADGTEARAATARILSRWQPRRVVCWDHPVLEALELADLARQCNFTLVSDAQLRDFSESDRREAALSAAVGVTGAEWGIAETGSLVLLAGPAQSRSPSLLPPRHLVVLTEEQIVDDLFDVFESERCDLLRSASYTVFITGPSKTGDIGLQLTRGVHGPGELYVLLVRSTPHTA